MSHERNALSDLFAACWKDDALKARFMSDPKAVLAENGIDVPTNMDVNVVENSDNCMNITMPAAPLASNELSDAELTEAVGGTQGFARGLDSGVGSMGCGTSAGGYGCGGDGIGRGGFGRFGR